MKIAAFEQETTSENANFCSNTVVSLYFKIRAKKFHAAKPFALSLHFLFRRDQNQYSNLTLEIMKMCEQILKKHNRKNSGNDSKEKIYLNAIQLLIKQNVPSLIYDYLIILKQSHETKSKNNKIKSVKIW